MMKDDDVEIIDNVGIFCQTVASCNDFISDINVTDEVITRRNGSVKLDSRVMKDDVGVIDDVGIFCQIISSCNDFISDIKVTDEVIT